MSWIGLIAGKSGDTLTEELQKVGFKIAMVGGRESDPGMDIADKKLVTDLSHYDQILNFCQETGIKEVIIGTGHIKAINLAKYLENNHILTSLDLDASRLVKDKVIFKNELINININTPKYISFIEQYDISKIINTIGLPCVVKSAIDFVQPQKVDNRDDLEQAIKEVLSTNSEVLIEEFIHGGDCTVAMINDGHSIKSLGAFPWSKAEIHNLKGFDNSYAYNLNKYMERKLDEIAIKIVDTLNIKGLSRVDFIIKDDIIYVLELNVIIVTGYKGTVYPFYKKAGINIAKEMVDNSLSLIKLKGQCL